MAALNIQSSPEIHHNIGETAVDMISATSKLQLESADVRLHRPNWRSYLQSQMISTDDYNFIAALEAQKGPERRSYLDQHKAQCARTFLSLMKNVSKDQTVRYVLTMIDDLLHEDRARGSEIFRAYAKKSKRSLWEPFLQMLGRTDGFVVNQTARIIAKLATPDMQNGGLQQQPLELMDGSDLMYYFTFLKEQLKIPNNDYVQTATRCLQMMLRIDEYKHAFMQVDGVNTLVSALQGRANFQQQYQLVFCLWCLSFNGPLAERMPKHGVIQILAEVLADSHKEKVVRIVLATLRNLLEKCEDTELKRANALQMVQSKVLKSLEMMAEGRGYDDPDMQDDIDFLTEHLQDSVQDLSSYDEYTTELKSGRLQWSPVHKSGKFWRENAHRFNEKNFELLKMLIKYLEIATDPLVLCVAAHDLGEYVRHYPRGRNIVEQLAGKQQVMRLLTHDDPNVRYHALLSIQKLMVHNWEYLGRGLAPVAVETGPAQTAAAQE